MAMTIVEAARGMTGGVDTPFEVHVAAALDPVGGVLGSESFDTTPAGYEELLAWLESFGFVSKVGVEGTGSYGAGLARFLRRAQVEVIEVDRPNRQRRRRRALDGPRDLRERRHNNDAEAIHCAARRHEYVLLGARSGHGVRRGRSRRLRDLFNGYEP